MAIQTTLDGQNVIQEGNQYTNPAYASPDLLQSAGIKPVTQTITSDGLTSAMPYNLPAPTNKTSAQTALGTVAGATSAGATADSTQTTNTQIPDTSAAANERTGILTKLKSLLGVQETKGDFTTQVQNEQDLAGKTQAVNDINKEITLQTQSYNDQIKELKKNSGGALDSGLNIKIQDLERTRDEHLANLNINKSVALGDLNTANDIINTKVAAKFEPIDNEIKNYQTTYQLLGNDLTESEKATAQDQLQQKKDKRDQLSTAYSLVVKTAAENGAPVSVQNAIDRAASDPNATAASIYAAAGKYATNILDQQYKQAQIASLNASAAAKASTTGTINGGVSQALQDAINSGTIDPNRINSRTLGIYNALAQAGTDAVGSHAGAAGETKAITDLSTYKSTATRTLGVLESNLPLVENLADKVNKTGIPGLDAFIAGTKTYTGNNTDVIKYVNSLKTLRAEYAQMLAKGSVATEGDKRDAEQAIPAGLSSAGYRALGEQLKLEATNILQASNSAITAAKNKSASNSGSATTVPTSTDISSQYRSKYGY